MDECFSTAHARRCGRRSRSICDETGSRTRLSEGRRARDGLSRRRVGCHRPGALRGASRPLRRLPELPGADAHDGPPDRPRRATASGWVGGATVRGIPELAHRLIAYKFLATGMVGPFTGFIWRPDIWVDAEEAAPCRRGIHACRPKHLPIWLDSELWEIELEGEIIEGERKLVAARGRLTRRIGEWTPDLAREFGRFCARRTRRRVGFLPFLSGFVADVDRFVAQNRIAIAGFAAARAAELCDGAAAYESERRAQ